MNRFPSYPAASADDIKSKYDREVSDERVQPLHEVLTNGRMIPAPDVT